MKSNKVTVIGVDARGRDNRPPKISSDIFGYHFRIAKVWLGINIESVLMITIDGSLDFFEGITKFCLKCI